MGAELSSQCAKKIIDVRVVRNSLVKRTNYRNLIYVQYMKGNLIVVPSECHINDHSDAKAIEAFLKNVCFRCGRTTNCMEC